MAVASSSQTLPLTLPSISSSQSHSLPSTFRYSHSLFTNGTSFTKLSTTHRRILSFVPSAGNEDADLSVSSTQQLDDDDDDDDDDDVVDDDDEEEPTPQDLENVAEIKRVSLLFHKKMFLFFHFHFVMHFDALLQVLELLKKNRDMLFGEVYPFHFFSSNNLFNCALLISSIW